MLNTTAKRLRCPRIHKARHPCQGKLKLQPLREQSADSSVFEVSSGQLSCENCQARYPIMAGVAVVVRDVRLYLLTHVKGLMRLVPDSEIPKEFLRDYQQAKREVGIEHIDEDLESTRVTALYVMNHYLRVKDEGRLGAWWNPRRSTSSPVLDSLVREYWDHGPFATIRTWVAELNTRAASKGLNAIELGCGVGGLLGELRPSLKSYLGVDSSFASVALARHLALGMPYAGKIQIPEDLLQGPVSREVKGLGQVKPAEPMPPDMDFVVGDFENPPVETGTADLALALNAIDMLEDPAVLPRVQARLLKKTGTAIQSCPYIWHEGVARRLRSKVPKEAQDSARAVEWLYQREGFDVEKSVEHLPWLFFKHVRQLEIYSVHLFMGSFQ